MTGMPRKHRPVFHYTSTETGASTYIDLLKKQLLDNNDILEEAAVHIDQTGKQLMAYQDALERARLAFKLICQSPGTVRDLGIAQEAIKAINEVLPPK